MGQQQIILILLVTVIVAIATVLAVDTMQKSHHEANLEAIRQKMLDATTLAQAYYRKNESMGGGGGNFEHITLQVLGIQAQDEQLGNFSLAAASTASFRLSALPVSGEDSVVSLIYPDRIEFLE